MRMPIVASLAALLLAGCAAADSAAATEGRTVSVTFEVRGGCAMTPDGCPAPVEVDDVAEVSEEAAAGLLAADLDALRRVDPGELGCGDAAVDGVGLHATVRRTLGEHLPAFEEATFCLSAADDSLAGVPELAWLYTQVR